MNDSHDCDTCTCEAKLADLLRNLNVTLVIPAATALVALAVLVWPRSAAATEHWPRFPAVPKEDPEPRSTFEAVTAGQLCFTGERGITNCTYRVGRDLIFAVVGIGDILPGFKDPNTFIDVLKAESSGDFEISFGLVHGCIIVKPNDIAGVVLRQEYQDFGFALVSPRNGRVYHDYDWRDCKADGATGAPLQYFKHEEHEP